MAQDDGGQLGQVHVTPATQAQQDVRTKPPSGLDARPRRTEGGLRLTACKDFEVEAAAFQRSADPIHQPSLRQHRIRDDQKAFRMQSGGNLPELVRGVAAEQQLAGGMKDPGFAHGLSPVRESIPGG